MIGIAITILIAGAVYIGLPALAKPWLRRRFLARVRAGGRACLTFDDGPDPTATPAIAEALARAGVRATFFMIGERARRHPGVVARVAQLGHEIGEHGHDHLHAWKSWPWSTARDLWRGRADLTETAHEGTGSRPLLRPPYGKLNLVTLLYSWAARREMAFWDIDPRDYKTGSDPVSVARFVLDQLGSGRVVLLHDGRAAPGSDTSVTLEAVRIIMREAEATGVCFAPVSEALASQAAIDGAFCR